MEMVENQLGHTHTHGIEEGGLGGEGLSLSFKLLIRLGNDKPILRTY
jgi:hypothetical protein